MYCFHGYCLKQKDANVGFEEVYDFLDYVFKFDLTPFLNAKAQLQNVVK